MNFHICLKGYMYWHADPDATDAFLLENFAKNAYADIRDKLTHLLIS
jgi:hypothetical protein